MMHLNREWLKNYWLHLTILACFAAAIGLLMFLDYFNLESIGFFNNAGFLFDYTWKGRLFLLFFVWLFALESFSGIKSLNEEFRERHRGKIKLAAILVCALIPLIYIIAINYLGLDQVILNLGSYIRLDYWKAHWAYWENSLTGDWPMSLEYVVFAVSFVSTMMLAYGKKGLKTFSISAALVAGIAVVYMIDTMYPAGAFKPFEALALPTAACAAVVLEAMGIHFMMLYQPGQSSSPIISMQVNGSPVQTGIAWPCAGVQSLFLFAVIILLMFKKSGISPFRQAIYFIIGAIGTYLVNVARIVSYFVILLNQGQDAALIFHNVYGEMYFFGWILVYILLIVGIQKYSLVERTRAAIHRKSYSPEGAKS
jgi:thaumarchaeosortase